MSLKDLTDKHLAAQLIAWERLAGLAQEAGDTVNARAANTRVALLKGEQSHRRVTQFWNTSA